MNPSALISSALHDADPQYTLSDIAKLISSQSGLAEELDPLTTISDLLPSRDPASDALLDVISTECSSKEILIASEECLEIIKRLAQEEDEQSDILPMSGQISRLVRLITKSKPPLRRILKSLIPELEAAITVVEFSRDRGRETLTECAILVEQMLDAQDINLDQKLTLQKFIESVVDSLAHTVQAELAKRVFVIRFPNLVQNLDPSWEGGAQAVDAVAAAYSHAGGLYSGSSKASLVMFVHSTSKASITNSLFTYLPLVTACIHSNVLLDESLAFLLFHLSPSPDTTLLPLLHLLPPLASAHPDPFIRHCTFRIIGLVVDLLSPLLQVQILRDLVSPSGISPQMRIAAVGLLKDNLLRALEDQTASNPLASPKFLQTFAPILFTPDPPDLFTSEECENKESTEMELQRLSQCLSLYYVLQKRDVKNRTGIRDRDNQANIERTLLAPMRTAISRWLESIDGKSDPLLMPLISLRIGLERIDDVLQQS